MKTITYKEIDGANVTTVRVGSNIRYGNKKGKVLSKEKHVRFLYDLYEFYLDSGDVIKIVKNN